MGVIAASTKSNEPFPANTESHIANFTDLVATAVANAESREELAASRARVSSPQQMRRGTGSNGTCTTEPSNGSSRLAFHLRITRDAVPAELPSVRADLDRVIEELVAAVEDLRELSHGLHPAVLSHGGLGPALRTLARRSSVPVEVHLNSEARYPPTVEVAAYYVVSEALTNTARHAAASRVEVVVDEQDSTLCVSTRDDGIGGADRAARIGLDRVA